MSVMIRRFMKFIFLASRERVRARKTPTPRQAMKRRDRICISCSSLLSHQSAKYSHAAIGQSLYSYIRLKVSQKSHRAAFLVYIESLVITDDVQAINAQSETTYQSYQIHIIFDIRIIRLMARF